MSRRSDCHPGRPHKAHGLCRSCYSRRRYTDQAPRPVDHRQDRRDRLDDLTWMAETGENAEGAAARLGISAESLERWCSRNNATDLYRRLRSRDPRPLPQQVAA